MRNPTPEDMNLIMEEKHRELRGFLCPFDPNLKLEWNQIKSESGITLFTHKELNHGSLVARRVDFTIKATPEKIAKMSIDCNTFFKITKMVEDVKVISNIGHSCVCLVRCKPLTASEPKREALIACNTKVFPNYTTIVRTSVDLDSCKPSGSTYFRNFVGVNGLWLMPAQGQSGMTQVSAMCFSDVVKPYNSETLAILEKTMIESAIEFKNRCESM